MEKFPTLKDHMSLEDTNMLLDSAVQGTFHDDFRDWCNAKRIYSPLTRDQLRMLCKYRSLKNYWEKNLFELIILLEESDVRKYQVI